MKSSEIRKIAKMMIVDPTRHQSRTILKALRDYYHIDVVEDPPYREYITYRDQESADSNKFHYFVVFPKGNNFVAANAWGRIGYPNPRVTDLGEFPSKQQAINVAKTKLNSKLSKGYKITPLT